MERNVIGVYLIKNVVTNEYYIGGSSDLWKRKTQHFNYLKQNKHHCKRLQESYNKYGLDNFTHEMLETCTIENLIIREQYYLDTMPIDSCLNTLRTAFSFQGENHPMFGRTHDEEARLKIIEARSKQVISHSEETRRKIGEANKGRPVNMDHIRKMIEARAGKTVWNKGLSMPNKSKIILPEETVAEMKKLYAETKSISQVSFKFNLDWSVTKRHLLS